MREGQAVYISKHNHRHHLSTKLYRYEATKDIGVQYNYLTDNICTCRNVSGLRRHQEVRYFSNQPRHVYAYQGTRSYTDVGVASVKALQRKKIKKIYLPDTDDRGVGSSELITTYFTGKARPLANNYYYNNNNTNISTRGVPAAADDKIIVIHEKLSPIITHTKSGSTSPDISSAENQRNNVEIGSNTQDKALASTSTQIDEATKLDDIKIEVRTVEVSVEHDKENVKYSKSNQKLSAVPGDGNAEEKRISKRAQEAERVFSSDSLVEHVHNLENPSEDKQSHVDMIENKLEREYRKMFSPKSKESKDQRTEEEHTSSSMKSTSLLRRRFEALRRGLAKKEDSKRNAKIADKESSNGSELSKRDVSIASDPPSLISRSYSDVKVRNPFPNTVQYIPKTEYRKPSAVPQNSRNNNAVEDDDASYQGATGMFKLWGKKFNLDESEIAQTSKGKEQNTIINESSNKKNGKRFFFFKKKSKEKPVEMYKQKKGVTAGRCEVGDGLMIKIGAATTKQGQSEHKDSRKIIDTIPEEYEDMFRRAWLQKFLAQTIESRNSVKVRWNNNAYATSSSTIFEIMENVYKDTGIIFRSKSEIATGESSFYKTSPRQRVNFVQDIEAWMVPKLVPDAITSNPTKSNQKEKNQNNIQVRISDQRWVIDKSKAFAQKIEVVLHSKNIVKSQRNPSMEYLMIDIPKGFFSDSGTESYGPEHTSNEEVFKIVEYETPESTTRINAGDFVFGDHLKDVKVTVSLKNSRNLESKIIETVIKRPDIQRDVVIQGSTVYIPKRCNVIGVGIITQKDTRIRKPILKIHDDYMDDESDRSIHIRHSRIAETYLQEYYRHWTPSGIDFISWCFSDSNIQACSDISQDTVTNQGDGTKSCPNIYDDYIASTIISPCGTSQRNPCAPEPWEDEEDKPTNIVTKFYNKIKPKLIMFDQDPVPEKRVLPKDSLEVFKRRKLYALSAKSQWACADDKPYSIPSVESRGDQNTSIDCPKVKKSCWKPTPRTQKTKTCTKHVCLPDCETLNTSLAKQMETIIPSGILTFKGSAKCEVCEKNGSLCAKHANVNPTPVCEIAPPHYPCLDDPPQPCSGGMIMTIRDTISPTSISIQPKSASVMPSCPPAPKPCPSPPKPCEVPPPTSQTGPCDTSPTPLISPSEACPPPKSPKLCSLPSEPCENPPAPSPLKPCDPPPMPCPPKARATPPESCQTPKPKTKKPCDSTPRPCETPAKSIAPKTCSRPKSKTASKPCESPRQCSSPGRPPCGSPPVSGIHLRSPPRSPRGSPTPPEKCKNKKQACPRTVDSSPPEKCKKPACPINVASSSTSYASPACSTKVSYVKPPCPKPAPPCDTTASSSASSCEEEPICAETPTPPTPPPSKKIPVCSDKPKSRSRTPPCKKKPVKPSAKCSPKSSSEKVSSESCKSRIKISSKRRRKNRGNSPTSRCLSPRRKSPPVKSKCSPNEPKDTPKNTVCPTPKNPPCAACCKKTCSQEFPWPLNNQNSSQDSVQNSQSDCTGPKEVNTKKKLTADKQSGNGCGRKPVQCPSKESCNSPPKVSGIYLKMKPGKKCSNECDITKQKDPCPNKPALRRSEDDIIINIKKGTDSTDEIREGLNIKVQDFDGNTLYERRDYINDVEKINKRNRPSVLNDMYKNSNVHVVSTSRQIQNMQRNDESNVDLVDAKSEASVANLIEINFKLKVTQGDKTTEFKIDTDDVTAQPKHDTKSQIGQTSQEVFMLKDEAEQCTEEANDKNDINIKIIIKNYKPKTKNKRLCDEFAQSITEKFQTVSTGYSDVLSKKNEDDNVYSVHRTTVNLVSSNEGSKTEIQAINAAASEKLIEEFPKQATDCGSGKLITKKSDNKIEKDKTEHIYSSNENKEQEIEKYNYKEEKSYGAKQTNYSLMTEMEEKDSVKEIIKPTASNSFDNISKSLTREEKKSILKKIMEKVKKTNKKEKLKQFTDVLNMILTDNNDPEIAEESDDLLEELNCTTQKANRFRDTDSMNNYYTFESSAPSTQEKDENYSPKYPTYNVSESSVRDTDESCEAAKSGTCLCSAFAARLDTVGGGGCCCRYPRKADGETNCDLRTEEDFLLLNYKTIEYIDVETQNSKYFCNGNKISVHSKAVSSCFNNNNDTTVDIFEKSESFKKARRDFACVSNRQSCHFKKLNKNTLLGISDEDKVYFMNTKLTNIAVDTKLAKDETKKVVAYAKYERIADVLQSYETKKAVLEIYAERKISDDGAHLVAKLPKFVPDKENDIERNYEEYIRDKVMMRVKR
ncbi:hypothetical protein evm_008811 [Chilo suppressalis]|nr:hypothetical protein evm_008811 [Chilo suppressalis]